MVEPNRKAFEVWWRNLQYAFSLPPPQTFPPFGSLAEDELRVLRRYQAKAQELARSTALNVDVGYSLRFTQTGGYEVDTDFPSDEAVRGFASLFRQFYSNEERASFHRALSILRVHLQTEMTRGISIERNTSPSGAAPYAR
jgi:hypothetical protein